MDDYLASCGSTGEEGIFENNAGTLRMPFAVIGKSAQCNPKRSMACAPTLWGHTFIRLDRDGGTNWAIPVTVSVGYVRPGEGEEHPSTDLCNKAVTMSQKHSLIK